MVTNYLDILAKTIHNNWDQPALTDFYLTEDGSAQGTSRGKAYTYGEMYAEIVRDPSSENRKTNYQALSLSLTMHLLDNYIISPVLIYESHRLIYSPENEEPIEFGGILAAAILAALIVDTEEGDARGIALDTDAEREEFFARYEREVRRDDWGYLTAEVEQLRDNYVQIAVGTNTLNDLSPNMRLLSLAMDLTVAYMRRLVVETYCEHIWEKVPWEAPFAQWLIDAARVETRRQRYLHVDWTDASMVDQLAEISDEIEGIEHLTFFFEGEKAEEIMDRYLHWLSDEYVAMKQEIPGARITSADRKRIFAQETDWSFFSDETEGIEPSEQKQWHRWLTEWTKFLMERLLPQKEIRFWADDVPEATQEHLLYHLQMMEQHPAHFRDLTAAIYAMRQLGYVRRKCSDHDMRQWLSEHLRLDYTARNNASQFRRAMKEHGRYTPEVRDEVIALETMGYFRFQAPSKE